MRLRTPTNSFVRVPELDIEHGHGTRWPQLFPYSDISPGTFIDDLYSAWAVRTYRWHFSVSLVQTAVLENAFGETWSWTATAAGDVTSNDNASKPVAPDFEKVFAFRIPQQANFDMTSSGYQVEITGGGINGTYDNGVDPPEPFSATWNGGNLNVISFTPGACRIFGRTLAAVSWRVAVNIANYNIDTGLAVFPSVNPLGFIMQTNWKELVNGTMHEAFVGVSAATPFGGINVVSSNLGSAYVEGQEISEGTLNSYSVSGDISIQPNQTLDYDGLWDSNGNALSDPLTASV